MLEEVDVFIINACISNAPFEAIAHALNYDRTQLQNRLNRIMKMGIAPFPGMNGEKIKDKDIRIFNLLEEGKTIEEIVNILNLCGKYEVKRTISKFETIKEGKPKTKPDKKEQSKKEPKLKIPFTKDEQEQIIAMKEQGLSAKAVADALGLNINAFEHRIGITIKNGCADQRLVQMWSRDNYWHKKSKVFFIDDIDIEILRRKETQTLREIAKDLGVDYEVVRNKNSRMYKHGIVKLSDVQDDTYKNEQQEER